MQLNITLKEAYGRASNRLRRKMEYSIHLLRKAEKLALAYDTRGVLPCFQRRQRQSGALSYRTVGWRTIRGTHEPHFCGPARGDPLCETVVPRGRTY